MWAMRSTRYPHSFGPGLGPLGDPVSALPILPVGHPTADAIVGVLVVLALVLPVIVGLIALVRE